MKIYVYKVDEKGAKKKRKKHLLENETAEKVSVLNKQK